MRVLHLIPGMAASSGPTQAVQNLAYHQAKMGYEITVAHLTGRAAEGQLITHPRVEQLGFAVRLLCHWGYSPSLRKWLFENVGAFDIVHMHSMWLYPNLVGARACRRHGVPYVVRPAGSLESWSLGVKRLRKSLYFRVLERPILERAAFVHAASEQEASGIRAAGIRNTIEVIPHGVDLANFNNVPSRQEARSLLGLPPDKPIVLFLSRIHPVKGLELLGESFKLALREIPTARLVIVGPDRHRYAEQVKQRYQTWGIDGATTFLGELTGHDKIAAYAAADVFVLPTQSENFGIVVAESLAAGTPVIVSRHAPWKCVQDANAGYWVDRNSQTFARCIIDLLLDTDKRRSMGQNARRLIAREFAWSVIARQLGDTYVSCVDGHSVKASPVG